MAVVRGSQGQAFQGCEGAACGLEDVLQASVSSISLRLELRC